MKWVLKSLKIAQKKVPRKKRTSRFLGGSASLYKLGKGKTIF